MSAAETVPANQSQPATPPAVNAASRAGGVPVEAPPALPALDPRFLRGDRGARNKSLARMDAWAEKNSFVAALSSPQYVGSPTNADPEVAAAKLLSLPASGSVRLRCSDCGETHANGREAIECDHRLGRHNARPARGCNWCGTLS